MKKIKLLLSSLLLVSVFNIPLFASNQMITLIKTYQKAKKFEDLVPEKAKQYYSKIFTIAKEMIEKRPKNPTINFVLAKCYLQGYGTDKDFQKAYKYFKKSYKFGNRTALCGLTIAAWKSNQPSEIQIDLYKKLKNLEEIYKTCKQKPIFLKLEKELEKK